METYPTYKPDGTLAGFEIENTWISFQTIYKILKPIEGIQDIKHQFKSDVCFNFTFQEEKCVIKEPPENKERFWVGLKDNPKTTVDISPIHKAFEEYKQNKGWVFTIMSKIRDMKIKMDNKKKSSGQKHANP